MAGLPLLQDFYLDWSGAGWMVYGAICIFFKENTSGCCGEVVSHRATTTINSGIFVVFPLLVLLQLTLRCRLNLFYNRGASFNYRVLQRTSITETPFLLNPSGLIGI